MRDVYYYILYMRGKKKVLEEFSLGRRIFVSV